MSHFVNPKDIAVGIGNFIAEKIIRLTNPNYIRENYELIKIY